MKPVRRYDEQIHALLLLRHTRGVSRYLRRFVDPMPNVNSISTRIMPREIVEDARNLFDRDGTRMATVVEYETDLPAAPAS